MYLKHHVYSLRCTPINRKPPLSLHMYITNIPSNESTPLSFKIWFYSHILNNVVRWIDVEVLFFGSLDKTLSIFDTDVIVEFINDSSGKSFQLTNM